MSRTRNEPQQKHHIGTVCKNISYGFNWFYRIPTRISIINGYNNTYECMLFAEILTVRKSSNIYSTVNL